MTPRPCPRWCALAISLLTLGVGVLSAQDDRIAGLGLARKTAIEVCGPNGEHAYFDRLVCSDGSLARYEQIGSEGTRNDPTSKAEQDAARIEMMTSAPIPTGYKDFHRVDRYSVDCSAGPVVLYVDRYHCPDPTDQGPPPGFSFLEARSPNSAEPDSGQVGLGLAKETAIEVCGPTGGRDYLDRLRCPDGSVVRSQRTGSMGSRNAPTTTQDSEALQLQYMNSGPIPAGQRDFHLIDAYTAECPGQKRVLYVDPYHCPGPKSQVPPPGFSLANGGKPR